MITNIINRLIMIIKIEQLVKIKVQQCKILIGNCIGDFKIEDKIILIHIYKQVEKQVQTKDN